MTTNHDDCCCTETIDDLKALSAAYRANLTHRLNQAIAERDRARDTAARLEAELARGFRVATPPETLTRCDDDRPATPNNPENSDRIVQIRPGSENTPPDTRRPERGHDTDGREQLNMDFTDLEPTPSDGSHLTGRQVAHIEAYMWVLLDKLGLGAWQVWVSVNLPPEDAELMIEPVEGRRCAMLHVAADWWERRSAEEKRVDLTHEALHLAHHDVDTGIRRFLRGSGDIADYVKDLVIDRFKLDLERMVDSLSYVVAPHLPPWPEYTPPKPDTPRIPRMSRECQGANCTSPSRP